MLSFVENLHVHVHACLYSIIRYMYMYIRVHACLYSTCITRYMYMYMHVCIVLLGTCICRLGNGSGDPKLWSDEPLF